MFVKNIQHTTTRERIIMMTSNAQVTHCLLLNIIVKINKGTVATCCVLGQCVATPIVLYIIQNLLLCYLCYALNVLCYLCVEISKNNYDSESW